MNKKVLIGFIATFAAVAVIAGIFVLIVNVVGARPSSRTDVWADDDETESSSYSEETEPPTTTTTRETQGRDYYENGGYKGMDSYYIIQDQSVDEIIAIYEYYRDLAHKYDVDKIKDFDKELKYPAHSQVNSSGKGVFMFYDQILSDEKIDHVVSFDAEGESNGAIEFSMKIRIHDHDKAMKIYDTFIERYSVGAISTELYDLLKTYSKGVKIKVSDKESRMVCYKQMRDDYGNYVWLIYVSEDY